MNGKNTGLPVLSGEFNRGYTAALMDVKEILKCIESDLRYHHKSLSFKTANQLISCVIENREKIRENMDGFFRWNKQLNNFEWYEGRQ